MKSRGVVLLPLLIMIGAVVAFGVMAVVVIKGYQTTNTNTVGTNTTTNTVVTNSNTNTASANVNALTNTSTADTNNPRNVNSSTTASSGIPAVTAFWVIQSDSEEIQGMSSAKLMTIDATTGEIVTYLSYPFQGLNAANLIPTPYGNHAMYRKFTDTNDLVVMANSTNGEEIVIATGDRCLDAPPIETCAHFVDRGVVSPDGNYLTYIKGSQIILRNINTGEDTILPIDYGKYSPTFSSKGTYLIAWGGEGLMFMKRNDTAYKSVDFGVGASSYGFSPDERYLVATSSIPNTNQTTAWLIDPATGFVSDSIAFSDSISSGSLEYGKIAWLTNDRFVTMINNRTRKEYTNGTLYLFTVANGKLEKEEILTASGKRLQANKVFRIDDHSILIETDDSSNGETKGIERFTLGGEPKILSSEILNKSFFVLGPKL